MLNCFPCLSMYLTENTPHNHGNCTWLPQYLPHRNCTNGYCNTPVTKKEMKEQRMNEPRPYIYMGIFMTSLLISVSQTDLPLTQTSLSRLKITSNLVTQFLTQCVYYSHMIPCQNELKNERAKMLMQNGHLFLERATYNDSSLFQSKHSCMNRWNIRLMSFSYVFLCLTQTHENVNTSKSCLFQNRQSHYYLVW